MAQPITEGIQGRWVLSYLVWGSREREGRRRREEERKQRVQEASREEMTMSTWPLGCTAGELARSAVGRVD